ncbi:MAG: Superoxide dismutase [Fe] [Candidatus Anoxychlamydiales bacterium]|nr:Superoxide dismutase [Fe] [Candidatus Anoxychlamydiales bacterium]NGX36057.1 Superoxide dismutase [Fe] [Candidatus Anoxychlamydiales bacterium]
MKKFWIVFICCVINFAHATYEEKDFSSLIKNSPFPEELTEMHLKLYSGYVSNTNEVLKLLETTKGYEWQAIKRRFSWEYNGMRLHELYFENLLKKTTLSKKSSLRKKIIQRFGSFDNWRKDFIETGKMRGIGWVILYLDNDKLINDWIDEHNIGVLENAHPLLIMDVWEHAYITAYGLNRLKYINIFLDNIDWQVVEKRYQKGKKG